MAKKKDIIFELNYRPENSKEMQKTVLSRLGSFLVFKKEVRGFFFLRLILCAIFIKSGCFGP